MRERMGEKRWVTFNRQLQGLWTRESFTRMNQLVTETSNFYTWWWGMMGPGVIQCPPPADPRFCVSMHMSCSWS